MTLFSEDGRATKGAVAMAEVVAECLLLGEACRYENSVIDDLDFARYLGSAGVIDAELRRELNGDPSIISFRAV